MEHCAKVLNKDPTDFKAQNLYKKGQVCTSENSLLLLLLLLLLLYSDFLLFLWQLTPVKMPLSYCNIRELTSQLLASTEYESRKQMVASYNQVCFNHIFKSA